MSAIDWIRNAAKMTQTDTMIVTEAEGAEHGCPAGTYHVEYFAFEGTLPHRMMSELLRGGHKLTNTETELEVLRLGNGYVSGRNICKYYRTTYTLKACPSRCESGGLIPPRPD